MRIGHMYETRFITPTSSHAHVLCSPNTYHASSAGRLATHAHPGFLERHEAADPARGRRRRRSIVRRGR